MQQKLADYISRCWGSNFYCTELCNRVCNCGTFGRSFKSSDVYNNDMLKSFAFGQFSESSTFKRNNF